MAKDKVKVGLLGFGTIGGGVAKVLLQNKDLIASRCSMPVELALVVDLAKEATVAKMESIGLPQNMYSSSVNDIIDNDDIDIMVELIGGVHPALEFITDALKKGKTVVTANKDLIASHGGELLQLASEHNTDLHFEASVAGGIPIIHTLKESLAANQIQEIMGILNGTTNYILTQMAEKGLDFSVCLQEAQKLGYAEANPTNDVEGFDAARKVAILASIAFNSRITDDQVYVEGITKISDRDIMYAKELGYVLKTVGIAKESESGIEARVHPMMIPTDHPLSSVNDVYNAVFVEGFPIGKTMFYGKGAGEFPTASAVVGDIIMATRDIHSNTRARIGCTCFEHKRIKPIGEAVCKYYIRLTVTDKPGVLAQITKILGEQEVSIATVLQACTFADGRAELVLVTHQVAEAHMRKAIDEIKALQCVSEIGNVIRVAGENDNLK